MLILSASFFLYNGISKNDLQQLEEESGSIPQGTFIYELYQAEFDGRMPNTPVEVTITGNKITIRKTDQSNITGPHLILESFLYQHDSGVWIITDDVQEVHSAEIGGCSGSGIPINFETKVVDFC